MICLLEVLIGARKPLQNSACTQRFQRVADRGDLNKLSGRGNIARRLKRSELATSKGSGRFFGSTSFGNRHVGSPENSPDPERAKKPAVIAHHRQG